MKAEAFHRNRKGKRRGFTLLEMTIAMVLSLGVASGALMMLNQHLSFLAMVQKFNFLRDDAPAINLLVSRIVGQANGYRLYASKADAVAGVSPVTTGARAVVLKFRRPNGTQAKCMIAFEGAGAPGSLNFYNKSGGSWPGSPNWVISSLVTDVVMSNDTGVVLMRLTGPNMEEITYVGTGE